MQLQIDIYAEVAEKYGLKNGDTHKFLITPIMKPRIGNAHQRRIAHRSNIRNSVIVPATIRII